MRYTLEITPVAKAELREASRWYDKQHPGLGMDFLLCAEGAIEIIRRNPEGYQKIEGNVRCKFMVRFPYGIFFRLHKNKELIEVIAVLHNHRDPIAWKKRI